MIMNVLYKKTSERATGLIVLKKYELLSYYPQL